MRGRTKGLKYLENIAHVLFVDILTSLVSFLSGTIDSGEIKISVQLN